MKRKIHTAEQIVNKLRGADAFMAKGGTLEQVSRQLGISSETYYNWRLDYNHHWPHSGLKYKTPAAFADARIASASALSGPAPQQYTIGKTENSLIACGT